MYKSKKDIIRRAQELHKLVDKFIDEIPDEFLFDVSFDKKVYDYPCFDHSVFEYVHKIGLPLSKFNERMNHRKKMFYKEHEKKVPCWINKMKGAFNLP